MFCALIKPTAIPMYHNAIMYNTRRYKTYLPTHEWLTYADEKGIIKMGISKKAGKELGEVTFIDYLVEEKDNIDINEELTTIESIKAVASICAPFNCEVVEINKVLENNLHSINTDPECENNSWILKLKPIK